MALLNFFKFNSEEEKSKYSSLHDKVQKYFPDSSEREIIIMTCIAGLCARIAYVDLDITEDEVQHLKKVLKDWTRLSPENVEKIGNMAVSEMKELSGIENHLYVYPLADILDRREKVEVIVALFALAASDGGVSNQESDEIRFVCRGLKLDEKYFLAARAQISESLDALKK